MASNGLKTLGKIGEFVKKYTGSNYNYEPSAEINKNFQEIGEIFGIPIYVDTGAQYSQEFLDFPTLADILNTIADSGINAEISFGECSVCMTITFTIPTIAYPPIVICLADKQCLEEKKAEKIPWYNKDCLTLEDLEEIKSIDPEQIYGMELDDLPPICDDPIFEDPILPALKPGQWKEYRYFLYENSTSYGEYSYTGNWSTYYVDQSHAGTNSTWANNDTSIRWGIKEKDWGYGWDYGRHTQYSSHSNYCYASWMIEEDLVTGKVSSLMGGLSFSISTAYYEIRIMPEGIIYSPIPPPPPPPPIETPSPPPDMNACCDDIKKLLARNEKMLKEIHKVINPEQFFKGDVQVPNCWIYPGHSPNPVKADDIPDALSMILRMLDRRIGYMPQAIQIKDANPEIEGDQGKSLIVNSLADLCKHIFEFQINAGREEARVNKALLKMGGANLFEAGTTHQLAIVIERMVLAITEYLDFEASQKKETFKMFFDPTKQLGKSNLEQHLDGLIKGHNQPIEVMEWKGGSSEKDKLNEILQKVSLCAAALSTTKPLEETIQEAKDLARVERMLIIKELQDRDGIPDLKEFNDDAEKGYPSSNRSPSVKANPYGFGSGEPKLKRTTSKSKKPKYTNKAKKQ